MLAPRRVPPCSSFRSRIIYSINESGPQRALWTTQYILGADGRTKSLSRHQTGEWGRRFGIKIPSILS